MGKKILGIHSPSGMAGRVEFLTDKDLFERQRKHYGGYIQGYIDGYEQGKKDEQAEAVYKKYTMNEIREACGLPRIEKEEVRK